MPDDKKVPKGFTLKTPENTEDLNESQLKNPSNPRGIYPVIAPDTDLKLMVALTQVLDYFRKAREEQGADLELTLEQEQLALRWFSEKAEMKDLN